MKSVAVALHDEEEGKLRQFGLRFMIHSPAYVVVATSVLHRQNVNF
jgi:hypothetical protein